MLGGKARYRAFVSDGVQQGHKEEYYEAEDQRFLGTEGFGETLREQQEEPKPTKRRALDAVVKAFGKELGVGVAELKSADRSWGVSKARTMIGYVLIRGRGYGLAEVAKYMGRDPATVGTLLGRLAARIDEEPQLRREIERLSTIVES